MELKEEMWMNRKFIKWEAAKIDVLLKISIWTPLIFECPHYSFATKYSKSLWHLDKGWDIENTAFLFYSKILITWEKIDGKIVQKRDFTPPYWAY